MIITTIYEIKVSAPVLAFRKLMSFKMMTEVSGRKLVILC